MTAMTKRSRRGGRIGGAYDVERIRTDFPILFREVYGKPLVYLDNGASAQKPRSVLDAIDHAYKMEYANVHRGLHYLSNAATAKLRGRARDRAPLPQCAEHRRDHLHAQRYGRRSTSSPAPSAWISRRATRSCSPSWSTTPTSCPGISTASARAASSSGRRSPTSGEFLLDEFERAADPAHQDGRHHAHVERAGHAWCRSRRSSRIAHARGIPVLVDGARRPCTCPSTCRTSTATSTPSPATRPTGPPASACSTPRRSTSTPCRPTRAAAT